MPYRPKKPCRHPGCPELTNDVFCEKHKKENNKIYGIMTHTCPIAYLPTEMFMSTRQNAAIKRKPRKANSKKLFKPDIDRSTEIWLGELEKKLEYKIWFCGHYHCDKKIDKIAFLIYRLSPQNYLQLYLLFLPVSIFYREAFLC